MAGERPLNALQIIFSFFLGLMVTAFIGVGVYTFYPPPETRYQPQIQQLSREQEDLGNFKDPSKMTDAERTRLRQIQDEMRKLQDAEQAEREIWGRNTSIILITFATLAMGVSLVRADQLRVISNGLLLGGLFTMIYGTGWIIATGTSKVRFFVMAAALAITLALGYLKFVRGRAFAAPAVAGGGGSAPAGVVELEARVEAIEARLARTAEAIREPERQ